MTKDEGKDDVMVVDRENRGKLIAAIERYLTGATTAFQFDDQINEISSGTKDETVTTIIGWLWYHYDDCTDHQVCLSKVEWNYFQRLLLILHSDARIEIEKTRCWSPTQLVAAAALSVFLCLAWKLGLGLQLLVIAIAFGPIAFTISRLRSPRKSATVTDELRLTPFSSFHEILAIRRLLPTFRKRQYPSALASRCIRNSMGSLPVWIQSCVYFSIASPILLAFQTMPRTRSRVRVVTPEC